MATAAPALKALGKLAQTLPLGEGEGSQGGPPLDTKTDEQVTAPSYHTGDAREEETQHPIAEDQPAGLPASMAPGLGTTGGAPTDADSQAKPADTPAKPADTPKATAKDANPAYPGAVPDQPSKPETKAHPGYPGATSDEPTKPEAQAHPAYPGATSDDGQPAQPVATPQPTAQQPPPLETQTDQQVVAQPPQAQQPLTVPTPTPRGPSFPPGPTPDPQAQQQDLVEQGHSPGSAQAIVAGQQPKTISGDKPAPPKTIAPPTPAPQTTVVIPPPPVAGQPPAEGKPPAPVDTLKADEKNRVDPVQLYSYLLNKFTHSPLNGYIPPDGDYWKIKSGSPAEWAAFGLAVAKQESDLNAKSYNGRDPGGSVGLFQFGQDQTQYTNGADQNDPQASADAFVRSVEHYLANKGSVSNMGETFGSIRRRNEAGQYITGAQKVAAGGSGKDLVSSGGSGTTGGGEKKGSSSRSSDPFAGQPLFSIPTAAGGTSDPYRPQQPPSISGGGGGSQAPDSSGGGGGSLNLFGGGGGPAADTGGGAPPRPYQPQQMSADTSQTDPMVAALVARGFTPQQALNYAQGVQNIAPGKGIGPLNVKGPAPAAPSSATPLQLSLTSKQPITPKLLSTKQLMPSFKVTKAPPAAPSGPTKAPRQLNAPPQAQQAQAPQVDPTVIQGLMKRGFTRQQALAFAAKATVNTPQTKAPPPAPAAPQKPASDMPPQRQVEAPAPKKQAPEPEPAEFTGRPAGSTHGDPNPKGADAFAGMTLPQALKAHAAALSEDDPRVKKQADGYIKGEHFVEGDVLHNDLLNKLPYGKQGRQRGLLGQAETAIADKSPMHLSYISAPKEAAKFPTRESRTVQYDEHSPEARLMGTTTGQLVGHSLIPLNVGIKLPSKKGEPHESYLQGISTNVMANNFQHINDKLEAMGRKSPYKDMGAKFQNDLEGYYSNLLAGHTATGRGYVSGTEHHPMEPDREHVPYKLSRKEADFIGTVINNTAAFSKHDDAKAIRELARVNGSLITPEGETNRMRHDIETHEPGWRERVLEPTIRSFKTGLIHEIHPSEEHMPETIRPGKHFQSLTKAIARTSERGRPDVAIAAALHHTFQDNKKINEIERDFSDHKIDEAQAKNRLRALGEDPDDYRYVGGSGGLITPYEDDPEALTPEEHTQMKDNLRQSWVSGKMGVEDYRKKSAEVPLPSKPSKAPPAPKPVAKVPESEMPEPSASLPVTAPKPKAPPKPKPVAPPEPKKPEAPEEKPTEGKVSDYLDTHPVLEKHPWAKDVSVKIKPDMNPMGRFIEGDGPDTHEIHLKDPSYLETLKHELVHLGQAAENKPRGASASTAWTGTRRAATLAYAKKLFEDIKTPRSKEDYAKAAGFDSPGEAHESYHKEYLPGFKGRENLDRLWRLAQEGAGHHMYRNAPGEKEARGEVPEDMPVHASGHPMPRSPRHALTLPPGTHFRDPDGNIRMVPHAEEKAA